LTDTSKCFILTLDLTLAKRTRMDRREILRLAEELVTGDRDHQHGPAHANMARIAKFWTAYLSFTDSEFEVTPSDVCAMMILLKVSRLSNRFRDDTFIDIAGYASLGAELSGEDT